MSFKSIISNRSNLQRHVNVYIYLFILVTDETTGNAGEQSKI